MATSIVASDRAAVAIEQHQIHLAVCRYRRQGPVCSTCGDLAERAERAVAAAARQIERVA
jgi:hypothetical protein